MANNRRMSLVELLHNLDMTADADFLRQGMKVLCQAIMELEVTAQTVRIPKVRQGSYFPSLLNPRRRIEKALVAVIQEAYVHGVSTVCLIK